MPLDVLDLDQCTLCANISYAEQPHARNSLSRAMLLKATMVFNLVAFLVALIQPASAFHIKRLRTDSGTVLRLRGDVRAGDFARLNSILQNEAIIGLEIRSGGGSLEDGVEIARVVRDKGLVVYVSKECNSVCAFIFFAAKERYIGRGCKIGVHSVSNQHGKEDAETAQSTVKMSRLLTGSRSAAFCYWQDRSDASSQYHVPEQSRTGRIKRAPKQSVSKPICRPGPKPRGNLSLRSSH